MDVLAVVGQFKPWLWTAETWAGFQFVVLAAAAIVAWFQVREARRLREASLRPFVIVDFETEQQAIYLVVSNIGATMARDVQISFDHPLEVAIGQQKDGPPTIRRFEDQLAAGIPSLAPTKRLATLFDVANHRTEGAYRDTYIASIQYRGDITRKPYSDELVLDFGSHRGRTWISRHDTHDVHERLKDIGDELRNWSRNGLRTLDRRDGHLRRAEMIAHSRSRHGRAMTRHFYSAKRRLLLRLM